jgi:hypothetical protein
MLINGVPVSEIYRDQAVRCDRFLDRQMVAAYTPWGIKKLDTRFCNRIRAFGRGEEYVEYAWSYGHGHGKPPEKEVEHTFKDTLRSLEKDIKECPHLHDIIKQNLLENLRKYAAARKVK